MNLELHASKLIDQINEFDDLYTNTRYARYLRNRHLELCSVVEGIKIYTFYRTKVNNRAFFALSDDLNKVIYYSELQRSNSRRFISRYIKTDYESYSWKDKSLKIKDFSSKVFLQCAMQYVNNILFTDYEQTFAGYTHWRKMAILAIADYNYKVYAYAVDINKDRYIYELTLKDLVPYIFTILKRCILGRSIVFKDRGLAIVKKPIAELLEKDVKIQQVSLDEFLTIIPVR